MTTITQRKRAKSKHQPVGRWITPEKRLAIYLRDGFQCLLCGAQADPYCSRKLSLDHRWQRSEGGTNESTNLFTACTSCNAGRKRGRMEKETGKRVRRHMKRSLKFHLGRTKWVLKTLFKGDYWTAFHYLAEEAEFLVCG